MNWWCSALNHRWGVTWINWQNRWVGRMRLKHVGELWWMTCCVKDGFSGYRLIWLFRPKVLLVVYMLWPLLPYVVCWYLDSRIIFVYIKSFLWNACVLLAVVPDTKCLGMVQVNAWLHEGASSRMVGKTMFNPRSSRSHAVPWFEGFFQVPKGTCAYSILRCLVVKQFTEPFWSKNRWKHNDSCALLVEPSHRGCHHSHLLERSSREKRREVRPKCQDLRSTL